MTTSDKSEQYDVIIVGAGIVGLAAAYHMKRKNPSEKILLLDKASGPGQGDTAKSVAAVRNVFSSEINRALANSSIDFYESVQRAGTNLNMDLIGYLWLLSERQFSRNESVIREMQSHGIQLRLIEPRELKEGVPALDLDLNRDNEETKLLSIENIRYGLLGERCGVIAAEKLVEFFENQFKELGGLVRYGCEVSSLVVEGQPSLNLPNEPLVWQQKVITGVRTGEGTIRAGTIVVATGCWTHRLLDPIGLNAYMKPRKKQVFVLTGENVRRVTKSGLTENGTLPFTVLPKSGVYLRPVRAENSLWVSVGDGLGQPFGLEENPTAEENYYTLNIAPVIGVYFPTLKGLRPSSMWAGNQDINTIDRKPVIYRENQLIVANGSSGGGIMKADALGRVVASVYEGKETTELYGGTRIRTSALAISGRDFSVEQFSL